MKVLLLILTFAPLVSCTAVKTSNSDRFQQQFGAFIYCEVPFQAQSKSASCGAACLASVANYYSPGSTSEVEILEHYPPRRRKGYSVDELRSIAEELGLQAFALGASRVAPARELEFLGEQIEKGRPVVLALALPYGPYDVKGVPIIEGIDTNHFKIGTFAYLPVLMNAPSEKSHFVVLTGFKPRDEVRQSTERQEVRSYLIMDPKKGFVSIRESDLARYWKKKSNFLLLCGPKTD